MDGGSDTVDAVADRIRERLELEEDVVCRRHRSPSTSSLPVVENSHRDSATAAAMGGGGIGNESVASLIGSDSALLIIKAKPPLPTDRGRKKAKGQPQQPPGMDTDDDDDPQLSRSGSKKGKRTFLSFFKKR